MKKRKVSTNPSNIALREKRIINLLKESPEGVYPKIIALQLRENYNTVKSTIMKMETKGKIKRDINKRGIYHLVENKVDGIFNFKFQNAIIICKIPEINKDFATHNGFKDIIKYRIKFCKNTSRATLRLKSPNGINIESILVFVRIFILEIEKNIGYEPSINEMAISSIEFNKDYSNLRLDGFRCLTLDSLIAQYKLYQKYGFVREEYKTKLSISPMALFDLLNSSHNYALLSLRTDSLKEEVTEIKKIQLKILANLRIYIK